MIYVISDKKKVNMNRLYYTLYYLMGRYNEGYSVSSSPVEGSINIFYGNGDEAWKGIHIPYQPHISGDMLCISQWDGNKYIGFKEGAGRPYDIRDGSVYFNYDIISLSFYLISCGEEYETAKRDDRDRYLAAFSSRREYIDLPFFDINSEIIYSALLYFNKGIELNRKSFEIMLTHDVDNMDSRNKYILLHNGKELLTNSKRPFGERLKELVYDMTGNRYLKISLNIETEKKRGAVSEFYFIEGVKHRFGKRYELKDMKAELDKIKESHGHKIGIHTNYFSYDDEELIRKDREAIEAITGTDIVSCRNHYLRFKTPYTWRKLRNAGILCDTTLGYSDANGFRAGTAYGFIPFDAYSNNIIDIYEVPLILMDIVVMEKNIPFEDKWTEIKGLIDSIAKYRGTASILWHQCMLARREYLDMYERILDYIVEKGGRFITSDDILVRLKNDLKYLTGGNDNSTLSEERYD